VVRSPALKYTCLHCSHRRSVASAAPVVAALARLVVFCSGLRRREQLGVRLVSLFTDQDPVVEEVVRDVCR
jgi:hypothetical protein